MLQRKTHYEQVPMGIVRKIVEEQIRQEQASEAFEETRKKTPEELLLIDKNNE